MSGLENKFSVFLVCEDVVYGALLRKNITYKELVGYARKKFSINNTFDISFHYDVGSSVVRIDDDNDVEFFGNSIYNSLATTSHKLFVKKVKLSSSKILDFDLNDDYSNDLNLQHDEDSRSLNVAKKKKQEKNDENTPFKWLKNTFSCMPEPPEPPIHYMNTKKHETPYGNCSGILKKGDDFDNKEHCIYVIGKKALDEGFEFKVRKSTTLRFDVICNNAECKWKIISSKSKNGDSWLLGTVNDIHTCSRTQLNPNHRNATKKLLGWLLAPKLKDYSRIYKPKDIINDINHEFNIDITYKKAWGGKNKGLEINSGCPLDSFSQLPYYFYNLKMANEGMVTHIETDDEGRFKMCFIAFGFAIRSFLAHMRPLLITDGAHLKGTYKGINLVLVGMDGNTQIVPISIGVSQGKTGESWTWFLLKFKECIGEVPNLEIITDRHPAIILACYTIFPNAFHGYCCRHLMMNCKMKSDKLQGIYWKTCKAYTPEEFQRRVSDLRGFRPEAYKKLKEARFETWSRTMCPADRYNYMTSNNAELINNLTRHVRKAPITQLMEWYRALLQKCDWATYKVMDRMQKSAHWNVLRIEYGRLYQVDDRRRVHQVDLTSRTCTCRKWQLSGSGYQQKDRKPSQNDKTEHGMEKTVQNQGQSPKMS
ncbi:transposase, MuDR, MULE transposase domain protein, partial [Tanacetum coccineum]